jgi:lipoprotein-anchoring transpeptidase ErfK/SrfK
VPYKTWLPYACYWNAGWALHGYASVPAQPASHGCARLPLPEARIVYAFARIGTPLRVI